MEILEFLIALIDKYGYIIVLLAIMLESAGIPMPGETALLIGAAFAGAGHLNITLVITCAATGAIVGDAGGYWIGRLLGRPFLDRHGKWLHLTPQRMSRLEQLFSRHGPMTVFFGRFFSLLRAYAALFAGVWHMPYGIFSVYNALGGVVWALCFGMIGYLFGQNLPMLQEIAHRVGWALSLPVVLIVVLIVAWRLTVRHKAVVISKAAALIERSFIGYLRRRFSWQIHWLLRHGSAAQYLIIHVTLGLLVAGGGIFLFASTAHSAFAGARIALWDRLMLETFQSWATPAATVVFQGITALGSYGVAAVALAGCLLFLLRRRWINAAAVAGTVIGGQLLVLVLKLAFARPRPQGEVPTLFSGFDFSFPSGHAMESLIVYGLLAYLLILWLKRWEAATAVILLTLFLVLMIGLSRLYLGANYLSDVLCGFAGGLVWLSSCLTALELLRRGEVGDRRRHKRTRLLSQPPAP